MTGALKNEVVKLLDFGIGHTSGDPKLTHRLRRRHARLHGVGGDPRDRYPSTAALLEAEAPTVRHEFIDGEIVAMAGGSDLHSALISALTGELYAQLRGTACGLRESNLRVRVQATGNALYADALVVCGKADVVREIPR